MCIPSVISCTYDIILLYPYVRRSGRPIFITLYLYMRVCRYITVYSVYSIQYLCTKTMSVQHRQRVAEVMLGSHAGKFAFLRFSSTLYVPIFFIVIVVIICSDDFCVTTKHYNTIYIYVYNVIARNRRHQ